MSITNLPQNFERGIIPEIKKSTCCYVQTRFPPQRLASFSYESKPPKAGWTLIFEKMTKDSSSLKGNRVCLEIVTVVSL